jgi:hypothetical protein
MAFVEFHSVEHAAYALQCSAELKMDANSLKISFAKEAIMHQIISQVIQLSMYSPNVSC